MPDRPTPTALDHLKFQRADWNELSDFKRELDRSIFELPGTWIESLRTSLNAASATGA